MAFSLNVFDKSVFAAAIARFKSFDLIYRIAALFFLLAIIGAGSYGGYRWYTINREQYAQKSFSECLSTYQEALSTQLNPQQEKSGQEMGLWEEVEVAAKIGYEQHSKSVLAPYFLVLQADALIFQEKRSQAISLLEQAISMISPSLPFYFLYKTKHALLSLDNEETREMGLKKMDELAQDKKNIFRDAALYHLGAFYWSNDDQEKAKAIWQQLMDDFPVTQSSGSSSWAAQAQAIIGQK